MPCGSFQSFFQSGDVEPAFFFLAFGDDARAIADQSVHQRYVRPVIVGFHAVSDGHIFRHEDVRFSPGRRRIGGQRSARIPRRWSGQFLQTIVPGHRYRSRHAPRLERSRRIQPLVFDLDARVLAAGEHGSKSLAQRYWLCVGQHFGIAPHAGHATSKILAPHFATQTSQIVADIEHTAVFRADILWLLSGEMFAAAGAFEVSNSHSKGRIAFQHLALGI